MPLISFLLPTRGRPDLAGRFLRSLHETAHRPEEIEVVLGVDEDDPQSHSIPHAKLAVRRVILPPGLTMGALNRACFEASTGRYVMLINDDVIVRTPGWDTVIYRTFARYDDELALVHVNDLLFQERLCTFPILSRKACLEIGICPACYRRYKIDDHIYDTYYLLAYLGHSRMIYLKDVVFAHENYTTDGPARAATLNAFHADDGKVYVLDPEALDNDAREFSERFEDRKRDARKLARLIETAALDNRLAAGEHLLAKIRDSYSYRPQCGVSAATSCADPAAARKVTVALVTSDLRRPQAAKCLSLLKRHTADCDLLILDNNRSRRFNRPREVNKVLRTARTDYVVLLNDDVYVTPGWLDGLTECVGERTGIVTPLHRDRRGRISYSGAYLNGDGLGTHAPTLDVPAAPRPCQGMCSAAVLIDRRKCGNLFFNDAYQECFADLDYALQVWEAGYEVLCTPRSIVMHPGGATTAYSMAESSAKYHADRNMFMSVWVATGRLGRVENEIWSGYDYLRGLTEAPGRIRRIFDQAGGKSRDALRQILEPLVDELRPVPKFYELLAPRLQEQGCLCRARGENAQAAYLQATVEDLFPQRLTARIARRLKGQAASAVKPLIVKAKAIAERHALLRRMGAAAYGRAVVAWYRYKRLPAPVRAVLDPAVVSLKRAVKPLLRGIPPVELGLYKGFRLVRVDTTVRAIPTMHAPRGLQTIGGDDGSVLVAGELSRIKLMVDDLAGPVDGPSRKTTHLLEGRTGRRAENAAVEECRGEDMCRIQCHKPHLRSMLKQVPSVRGQRVLDVGCSDGPACDLLLSEEPAAVTGIDVMEAAGCADRHAKISYAKMDAGKLPFDDERFDLAYSIATLEHCRDPYTVLEEMKRVTRKGGCVYVQAAPLYFSPFGHHMFGYFDDYPWIHLRLPIAGILEYCRSRKIDGKIRQALGRSADDYVRGMMSADHVNGLTYQEYRLTEFLESPDIEVLGFSRSREGRPHPCG
ncbi:MAG: methyltransferase domain-containing protein [Thermoguttaceae bacterium]